MKLPCLCLVVCVAACAKPVAQSAERGIAAEEAPVVAVPVAPVEPQGETLEGGLGRGTVPAPDGAAAAHEGAAVGRLSLEVIRRVVRQGAPEVRRCYNDALRRDPNLTGRISVHFVIGREGAVTAVSGDGKLSDRVFEQCVLAAFARLTFPKPDGGIVKVTYPLVFTPGG